MDQRRNEILASAADAFRRLGVRGAGMRTIADAAGLSTGNLYYYFRNKPQLVYYCQDRALDELLDVAQQAKAARGAAAQLAALIRGHLRVLLGAPASGVVHLEFGDLPADLLKKLVHKRDRYEAAVRALIADGQKRGDLTRGDAKLTSFALLGALNWAARWFRPGGGLDAEAVADGFARVLLEGLVDRGVRYGYDDE